MSIMKKANKAYKLTQNLAVLLWFPLSLQLTTKAPLSFTQVNAALYFYA